MMTLRVVRVFTVSTLVTLMAVAPVWAQTKDANAAAQQAKLGELLKAAGITFDVQPNGRFAVRYTGKNLATVHVTASVFGDLVVFQTIVGEVAKISLAQLTQLLRRAFEVDLAKVGIESGNVIVLNETELRLLDAASIKRVGAAVALFADEAWALLSAAAPAPGPAPTPPPAPAPAPGRDAKMTNLALLDGRAALKYDAAQWKIEQVPGGHQLQHAAKEVFLRVTSERTNVSADRMPDVLLKNLQRVDPKAKITLLDTRTIGGRMLPTVQIEATIKGTPFTYYAHFYTSGGVTLQLTGFATRDKFAELKPLIEGLVDGFEVK